jgi:hypothetical protein
MLPPGSPSGPATRAGATRSIWPPACSARSPPATPTAPRAASAPRFPARKTLEEFDFHHLRGLKREAVAHLGTLDFVAGKENVVFLGPPVINRA